MRTRTDSMNLLMNGEIERDAWDAMILANPYASPFQTPDYFEFFNSVQGYAAEALAVECGGRLAALAVVSIQSERGLRAAFSRRGILFGGPLFSADRPEALEFLLAGLRTRLRRKAIYLETRNGFDYSPHIQVFGRAGWTYVPYGNFHLHLDGKTMEAILSGMQYNRRREIRLSLQEGARYEECSNEADVEAVYAILKRLYRERVRRPLPPLRYFTAFFRSRVGKVFVVKHGERIIGGSFCPILRDRSVYTLYYCGDRAYHRKIFPTHLAVLAAAEYGIRHGIPLLDFMGAGKPGIEYGVRNYKKEFGGSPVEHGRFLRINQPVLYRLGKIGLAVLSKGIRCTS